jgi:hypothetical protein
MKLTARQSGAFRAILSGSYTPYDVREFVQLCYLISRPHIIRKVRSGKLDLSILGISGDDAVYDCLADVFRRDATGKFVEIDTFFQREVEDPASASGESLLVQLRRLVIGKVNNNLVRLYSEADPALGKILRNIKLALTPESGLEQVPRFNEACLAPAGIDRLAHNPPFTFEALRGAAAGVILIHDQVPEMLRKLRTLLVEQQRFQRIVPMVWAGLVFKEIYTLGWEPADEAVDLDDAVETDRLNALVEKICGQLNAQLRKTYVETGKLTEGLLEGYCCALRKVLQGSYLDQHLDGSTFYEYLREHFPELTRESYRKEHKATLEYIVKLGKSRLREELRAN